MKKLIIAAAITALFSTMATANSGLADRINEARSYPNKTIGMKSTEMACIQDNQDNRGISKYEVKHEENESDKEDLNHAHS